MELEPNQFEHIENSKLEDVAYRIFESMGHGTELHDQILLDDKKLAICRHEISITIIANIMEEDETGENVTTTSIAKNNYRIPVPANRDHNEYLKAFFDHFENCMKTSAKQDSEKAT